MHLEGLNLSLVGVLRDGSGPSATWVRLYTLGTIQVVSLWSGNPFEIHSEQFYLPAGLTQKKLKFYRWNAETFHCSELCRKAWKGASSTIIRSVSVDDGPVTRHASLAVQLLLHSVRTESTRGDITGPECKLYYWCGITVSTRDMILVLIKARVPYHKLRCSIWKYSGCDGTTPPWRPPTCHWRTAITAKR